MTKTTLQRFSRRRSRGFTAVEVLAAMTLFAIGAAGVISMQKASIQGNADARRYDIATGIGAEWIARLRRDSMSWTEPNATVTTNNFGNTLWLRNTSMLPTPLPDDTGWLLPGPVATTNYFGTSYAFDVLGREVPAGSADTFYCVNYRLGWLQTDPANAGAGLTARAEVRVFWPRFSQPPAANCNPATANGASPSRFHFLYTTTTVRRNAP